jgi:hypothetical protein
LRSAIHYSATKGKILPSYESSDIGNNVFLNSLVRNPTSPVYEADSKTFHQFRWLNPLSIIEYTDYLGTTNNVFLNLNGQYLITKNLMLSMNTGFRHSKYEEEFYQPQNIYNPTGDSVVSHATDKTKNLNWETRLSYRINMGNHNFCVSMKYLEITEDVKNDKEGTNGFLDGSLDKGITRITAQIDYNFKKYFFLSALMNREFYNRILAKESLEIEPGSVSRLILNEKINYDNYFPAIYAGLDLSRNLRFFDELVVKVGYGITGHVNSKALDLIFVTEIPEMEKTHELSAGVNFRLWKGRASGSLLYYQRNNKNAYRFWPHSVITSPGFPTYLTNSPPNEVWLRNSGIEASIYVIPISNEKIQWNTSLCFFSNKNLFVSTQSGADNYHWNSFIYKTGKAYPSFYVREITGYQEWGEPIYGTKYLIKGQPVPKFEMGWNNNLCIAQKINLSFSFRYAGGYKIFNETRHGLSDRTNIPFENLNHDGLRNYDLGHWTSYYDDTYLEDASYLRMENITLGYTLKPKSENTIRELTVFMGADNLFTITGYHGYDPAGYSTGFDNFDVYPLAKSYFFGLRMNF